MKNRNIAVLLGSFHHKEAEEMIDEVRLYANQHNLVIVAEVWVPGSMEKPLALKKLLKREDVHAVVVLGIIEKGETQHGFVMARSVIDAIIRLQLEHDKPVGVGILGPGIMPSQIQARVRPYARAAAEAALKMLTIMEV